MKFKSRGQILNETLDFCKYYYCLQEETAKDYFEFLKKSWDDFDLDQSGNALDAELDSINIRGFNSESKDLSKEDNYFSNSTLSEFKLEFIKVLKEDKSIPSSQKRKMQMIFNNYYEKFKRSSLRKYVDWED